MVGGGIFARNREDPAPTVGGGRGDFEMRHNAPFKSQCGGFEPRCGTPRRYKRQRVRQGHLRVGGQLAARPYSTSPTQIAMANLAN